MDDILAALGGLPPAFDVHTIDEAWYSVRSLVRAVGGKCVDLPKVQVVRVKVPGGGVLELHPADGRVRVRCYCCFGGDPERGTVPLAELKAAVVALRDHYCPPWPG